MVLDKEKMIFVKNPKEEKLAKLKEVLDSFKDQDMKICLRKFKDDYNLNTDINECDAITFKAGSIVQITYSKKADLFLFRTQQEATKDIWYKMSKDDFDVISW